MKLVIMTKPTFFVEEDKILTTLFDEGMDNLHLYKPNSSPMYSERLLSLLPDIYYNRITVHEHYYLKSEYNLRAINIDQPEKQLPEGYKGKFSRTCNTIGQIKLLKKKAEYLLLNNVLRKTDDNSGLSITELERAASDKLIDKHVYAMGEVNSENIKLFKDLGFGGVVICQDLWDKFDIHNEIDYKRLISQFEKIRKAIL